MVTLFGSRAEFARKKRLSKSHRLNISRALRGRKKSKPKEKPTRQERLLLLREQEIRSRNVRNIGYSVNAASKAVQAARMTAKWLGVGPRPRRTVGSSLRTVRGGVGSVAGIVRDASYIGIGSVAGNVRDASYIGRRFGLNSR